MDNEDSFSYSPEAVPPVPSPPITVNQPIHDLENKINEEIQKGDPINAHISFSSKDTSYLEKENRKLMEEIHELRLQNMGTPSLKALSKKSLEVQVAMDTIPAEEPMTKRKKKQLARILSHTNTPFTPLEQAVMNRNEEIKDKISECSYEINKVYDFQILDDEPTVTLAWKDSKQHLAFTKFNFEANRQHFFEKGNDGNYKKMLKFIEEHPEYKECGIPDEEFNKPEDANEEEPEVSRKNTGGKRLPQKQPKKKGKREDYLVGPPNPPKSK